MERSNFTEELKPGIAWEMIHVEGGTFGMGSDDSEAFDDEKPVHEVTVGNFYIGKYPVTQLLWLAVMGEGNNPSFSRGDSRPIEQVSWEDTQAFIKRVNEKTGKPYRLLTEAEWEYAARGGQKSRSFKYSGGNKLKELGWYTENSYGETKAVGLKRPNELGIYDMSGNVFEWVEDQWHDNYEGAPTDGSAWVDREEGADRVIRGGGWIYDAWYCRVSPRYHNDPTNRSNNVGFRLGLSLQFGG